MVPDYDGWALDRTAFRCDFVTKQCRTPAPCRADNVEIEYPVDPSLALHRAASAETII